MEINNNPLVSLIPVALGEKNTSPVQEVDKVSARAEKPSQQFISVVSSTEKQTAKQRFENNLSQPKESNLVKDDPTETLGKGIRAYSDNAQSEEKKYLSDVLGIDVYS